MVEYDVAAVDGFLPLLRLDEHVGLLLQRVHHKLGQPFVHVLDLAVEPIPDEELLLREPLCDDPDPEVLVDALDVHPLAVLEGVQHGGVREADLPVVVEHHVSALDRGLPPLFQDKAVGAANVLVVSATVPPFGQALDDAREALAQEALLPPLSDEVLEDVAILGF